MICAIPILRSNAVSQSFTKTDLNHNRYTGTGQDAAKRFVKYALIGNDGVTGKFFYEKTNQETGELPW
jgi:hypothetical protein